MGNWVRRTLCRLVIHSYMKWLMSKSQCLLTYNLLCPTLVSLSRRIYKLCSSSSSSLRNIYVEREKWGLIYYHSCKCERKRERETIVITCARVLSWRFLVNCGPARRRINSGKETRTRKILISVVSFIIFYSNSRLE